jgi:D-glycero-beta-D-manno-heptose-7-phosphate kinase
VNLISEDRFDHLLDTFAKLAPVLVVGDIGIDKYTLGEVSRISPEAPVPVLEVKKEWMKLGLAANVSDNLKSLEIESTLCGIVGDDRNAGELESLLEEHQLKTWGILRDPTRHTTFKERLTTNVQQICRVDYESKGPIDPTNKKKLFQRIVEFSEGHSSVVIEDYGKGLFDEESCQFVIKTFTEMGKIVTVDASRYSPPTWYRGATLLKPNYVESKSMVNLLGYREDKVEKIAEILVDKLSVEKLVITLGSEGMAFIDTKLDNKLHRIPTVANEVFDVSGAGDTAISAITATLVAGASLEEACWFANCAAGVVVGKKGTALVGKSELKAFYDRLRMSLSH